MGFAWSLFYCQTLGEHQALCTPGLSLRTVLRDRGQPLVIFFRDRESGLRHYIYVDNMGIISLDE
eukprot:8687606-Lingulodinium_polyedra.AAC.1